MSKSYDLSSIAARLASLSALHAEQERQTEERQAAVATILRARRPGDEVEVLLIRRAEREGDPWSGQMAFPGGRRDPSDRDLCETAKRETLEEVGLDLGAHARLLGRLPEIPAVARAKRVGMNITPFVFALSEPEPPPFSLSDEVAETLWAPLGPLGRGEHRATYPYHHDGQIYQMPALSVDSRIVWGLTYRMLEMLFDVLGRNDESASR